MKTIIKQKMQEGHDGRIYEITHFNETIEYQGKEITQTCVQFIKTPYCNQEVKVTDETKSLIAKIARGRTL
jgi:hypothetical protein